MARPPYSTQVYVTAQTCLVSGIYEASCSCSVRWALRAGEVFPPCWECRGAVTWLRCALGTSELPLEEGSACDLPPGG